MASCGHFGGARLGASRGGWVYTPIFIGCMRVLLVCCFARALGWQDRFSEGSAQQRYCPYPPHISLSLARSGVPVSLTIRQVATPKGTGHPSHSPSSGFFSRQAPIGHPCLSPLPVGLLPSQARAHGEGRRGIRQQAAGHAPLDAFSEDTPPSSPAARFPPLPSATCKAFPRGTTPPPLYISHIIPPPPRTRIEITVVAHL